MYLDHLTDQQIQSYVEGESIHNPAEVEEHLKSCQQCRKQVNAYKFVRSEMVQEPKQIFFSDSFEDAIMTRILLSDNRVFQIKDYLVAAFTFVMAIALLCYPFLYDQMRTMILHSYSESWSLVKQTSYEVFSNCGSIGGCLAVPVIALIIILAFNILDKMYIQPHLKLTRDNL